MHSLPSFCPNRDNIDRASKAAVLLALVTHIIQIYRLLLCVLPID